MSLVDAVALEDGSGGTELSAPRRSRRHALVVFAYVSALTGLAIRSAMHARFVTLDPVGVILPVFFWLIAAFAWGVRRGRLRIEPEGVRWGYELFGFRMRTERIAHLRVYRDGVAVKARRSRNPWFLAARDWDRWDEALTAFAGLGVAVERIDAKAPLRVRMQAYGLALDVLLVIDSVLATLAFFL